MTIPLRQSGDVVLLPVRAQAGSRRQGIIGEYDGALKIAVTQAAEKGRANREILKVLAKALQVSRSQLTLTAGATSPHKVVQVAGIVPEDLQSRLQQLLHSLR